MNNRTPIISKPLFTDSFSARSLTLVLAPVLLVLPQLLTPASADDGSKRSLTVGSKSFTENEILGDMLRQLISNTGVDVTHEDGMGGTNILWESLLSGEIDMYVDYTGTLKHQLLSDEQIETDQELREHLRTEGILMTDSLGFQNRYALAMKKGKANKLGIETISDLRRHPDLALGFNNEFLQRDDGWPGLKQHYNLPQSDVSGMTHALVYEALNSGRTQVCELYTTDAKIRKYDLKALKDDRNFWPDYRAIILYRTKLKRTHPQVVSALQKLEGQISEDEMISMNSRVELEGKSTQKVAQSYLEKHLGVSEEIFQQGFWSRLRENTLVHLWLVCVSMVIAILISIPLGIWAAKSSWEILSQGILGGAGVLQTIPALALLVFMIPLLGTGARPTIVALFLYSLLPIIRNTYTGLNDIPEEIRESAEALGLPAFQRLVRIELPMAIRPILAGIKISLVINVGTATIGAFIGAGGYGKPIMEGLRLADTMLIMEGAIPASLMALAFQGLFDLLERYLISPGLRQS